MKREKVYAYLNVILEQRAAIYWTLSIWIMLFYIAKRIGVPGNPGIISPLINMGNVAVDIFLFLSGYCVHKSWKKIGILGDSIRNSYLVFWFRISFLHSHYMLGNIWSRRRVV